MERSRSQGARWAGRFALVLVSAALAVATAEVAVRLLGSAPDVKPIWVSSETFVYRRSPNPLLSFEIKPDYRNASPDLYQTYERTNSHGQRDRERSLVKPAGTRRVILLGDSVVEGTGVAEVSTISRQLEASYPEGTVEVLNFGVSGYCTRAEVELLEVKGLAFDPDVVVLLFVENDFQNFNAEAFQLGEALDRPAWVKQAFLRSAAFRLVALRFDLWGFGSEQDPMKRSARAIGANNVVEGLQRLRELAERDGFLPVVAVWPRFENDAVVDLPTMPGSEALVVERLAAAAGLPSLRLSPFFRSDLASRPGGGNPRALYTIGDRMHPSAEGCRLAASALRDMLDGLPSPPVLPPRAADDPEAVETARALGEADQPNYARVFARLGNLAYESGDLEGAAAYYRRGLEEDPDSVESWLNLGIVLHTQRRLDEAAEHFREALKRDPEEARAWLGLGHVFEDDGQPERARESYESALRARPGYGPAWGRLGSLFFRAGDRARARGAFLAAIEADPGDASSHNNLGRLLEADNDLDGAAREYEAALAIDPQEVEVRNNLGIVRALQGRNDEAIEAFRTAIAADPTFPRSHANLGAALRRAGRADEAVQAYREAVRLDPDYLQARVRLGELLAERGDGEEAAGQWREALERARGAGRADLVRQIEERLRDLAG